MPTSEGVEPSVRAISGTAGATIDAFNWKATTPKSRAVTVADILLGAEGMYASAVLSSRLPAVIGMIESLDHNRVCRVAPPGRIGWNLGTPIFRLASFKPPIGRLAFPGTAQKKNRTLEIRKGAAPELLQIN
jgi:hypothetical protein